MQTTIITNLKTMITGTYKKITSEIIKDQTIAQENIAGGKFEEVVFENVIFIDCEFQSTVFSKTKFIDCKFVNCNFSFTKLNDCNLIACKFENCNFCITNSLNCNFLSCTYINNSWEESSNNGTFHNCNIEILERTNMEITLTHEALPLRSNNLELCVA
jgi:uncharacterized protein YjbI with pentapeptide repeats